MCLPVSAAVEIALRKAIHHLHPSQGFEIDTHAYHEAAGVIIEQAALAIMNYRATHEFRLDKPMKKSEARPDAH